MKFHKKMSFKLMAHVAHNHSSELLDSSIRYVKLTIVAPFLSKLTQNVHIEMWIAMVESCEKNTPIPFKVNFSPSICFLIGNKTWQMCVDKCSNLFLKGRYEL